MQGSLSMFAEGKRVAAKCLENNKNNCYLYKNYKKISLYVDKTLELISTYSKIESVISSFTPKSMGSQ